MKKQRKIKVQRFGDGWRQHIGTQKPMSRLLLAGHWLNEAGFKPGYQAEIEVENGRLIICASKRER